ncbi:hypothetical protein [Nitrosomonas oligotropha]|uniref:hypothetical protein n=1 Tax=Nitrosomonas oligotropha TaxID=42354 RepID=UPI0013715D01|nr:hypothetical protein [Nitrosomonas oligotropha]
MSYLSVDGKLGAAKNYFRSFVKDAVISNVLSFAIELESHARRRAILRLPG